MIMVRKQDLLLFLKDKGENVTLIEIEEFLNKKEVVETIGFTQGSLFINKDAPVSFTTGDDLKYKLSKIEFGNTVTAMFNAVSKASAAVALTVIKIFVESLGFRIKAINAIRVVFVKQVSGKLV